MSFKAHFRRFLDAEPGRLHFAAHSHHPWPDATLPAQIAAWEEAVTQVDEKWDRIFGRVWPEAQRHVAEELGLPDPATVVFAPNTHEFVVRLFSCLPEKARIVTSDSEFHSFERQTRRLEEDGLLAVTRVPAEPFATFGERLVAAAIAEQPHLVFFSQVFFNSCAVVDGLDRIVAQLPPGSWVVIDGYHGFCAVPTDLSAVADRAFYLAGGYKYAMAGEGACFLHVPEKLDVRPRDTGWFAAFGALTEAQAGRVPYAPGGARFLGATFDASGLYRFNAAMRWRKDVGLDTKTARAHAHTLQERFVGGLAGTPIDASQLLVPVENPLRGQFLTFRTGRAKELTEALKRQRVIVDARDDRLRFGFGVYQDEGDVDALLEKLRSLGAQ